MTRMRTIRAFAFFAAMLSSGAQAAFQYSGTVVDQRGKGYPGIVVRLSASTATAVTDTQGRWSLSGVASVSRSSNKPRSSWVGRNLELNADQPHRFEAEVVDLLGKRVGQAVDVRIPAGRQNLPWVESRPWLRTLVRWDGGKREAVDDIHGPGRRNMTASRSFADEYDTLIYSESGKTRVQKAVLRGKDSLGMVQFLSRSDVPWDTLVDARDGNKYRVVTLGGAFGMPSKQQWMSANLRYVAARGSSAPVTVGKPGDGQGYSWATATALADSCDTSDCFPQIHEPLQGVCPQGWLLTSDKEWQALWSFVLNQDERLYYGRGILESVGAPDPRWADVKYPYVPPSEVRDFFGLSIPPTTLDFWLSTPWTDQFNVYEEFTSLWQDFRRNARVASLQTGVAIDEGRKTNRLPVRCYRSAP